MRRFFSLLPILTALVAGCSSDNDEPTPVPPPPAGEPSLAVQVVSLERTQVVFELTSDKGVDYAYSIVPEGGEAPASAEALFTEGGKTGMFEQSKVSITDRSISGNSTYTLYAAARTINPFVYSELVTIELDTHSEYTEAITLESVSRNGYSYHIKPEAAGHYRHICCRKSDYDWLVSYMGITPAMYVGTFGLGSDQEQTFRFEDAYNDDRDNPVYIYSGTEYMIIYGMTDPSNSFKVNSAKTLTFSTIKVDEAPYGIDIKAQDITSTAASVTVKPEEGIERFRVLVATTTDFDGLWIEGESVVRGAIIGNPKNKGEEYYQTAVIDATGLTPNTEYTVGVVGFDKDNREKLVLQTFNTTAPTGPAPSFVIEPQQVDEPWHSVAVKLKAQHTQGVWVCLETKAAYDNVLNDPSFTGTLGDIIKNNGIALTNEQLEKALSDGVLCQSNELAPFTEYIYGFYGVNDEQVTGVETYEFRTEAVPEVDLRLKMTGEFEASITDMDDHKQTFRVTISAGENDALKSDYESKGQLAILGFEPCGVAYNSPQDLLDNGWAATEEEANANYGPKIILEVNADETVTTGTINPLTSVPDFLMADYNGQKLHLMGYGKTSSGEVVSSPLSFPVEVSDDCNTITIKTQTGLIYGSETVNYYPGVYKGDSPWYGGTDIFRGATEMVLTRISDADATNAVKCSPAGPLLTPLRVRLDLSNRTAEATPRTQMLQAISPNL